MTTQSFSYNETTGRYTAETAEGHEIEVYPQRFINDQGTGWLWVITDECGETIDSNPKPQGSPQRAMREAIRAAA